MTSPVQLWVIECPYCYREIHKQSPPCGYCGVFWGPGDVKMYQAGPPGAHPPETSGDWPQEQLESLAEELRFRQELAELDRIAEQLWSALIKGGRP